MKNKNMKKVKWILEMDLFTDIELDFIDAIERSGRDVLKLDDTYTVEMLESLYSNDCVVFYGSLGFARKIIKHNSFIPGVYLNEKNFECKSYYSSFGDELLHQNYIMMPYGDLLRRKDYLFNLFGEKIFIRPSSGLKNFTGTVLDYQDFESGVELAGFYDVPADLLCIVSNAKNIQKEWRFVIVDGNVVSGSLYRDWTIDVTEPGESIISKNSKSVMEICTDENAFNYANKMAKLYNPDPTWTIDITLTEDGEYKVIEIGCFSCADLYANDLDKVVDNISEIAENEWKEYQDF